jgi:hypothetical protein
LTLAPGSITTALLADKAVTAAKLDDQSSAVVAASLPASGAYVGQLGFDSATGALRIWDGSVWQALKAAGSINTLTYDNAVGPVALAGAASGDSVTLSARLNPTSAAAQFLAGPSGAGGVADYRTIVGADLPVASALERGAVQVSGNGLRVTGSRLEIDNDITASAGVYGLVDVNAKGLVIGSRRVQATDLPIATTSTVGVVMPGSDLTVTVTGVLDHDIKIAGGGTYTKLTVNATGHITAGAQLTAADIPDLDAAKITTGEFDARRLADHSVTAIKLADYATAYIQDVQPANAGNTIGQLWLNPLAQQIRMWDGNVWVPIGVGALSEQNLRFCGLFTAVDGKITILTQFGRDAGYKVGDVLPVATDQLTGSYFVCDTAGNGVAVTPGVNYDPGDWSVCLGVAQGWERVDTLSGGGGGGGASTLDGLIDVDAPSPGAGQFLGYDGVIWKAVAIGNATAAGRGLIELATQAEVDAGTDTERAVTPATLKTTKDTLATAVSNITNLQTAVTTIQGQTVDATTTVKGIVRLADAAAVTAGTAGLVVTADQLKTTNDAVATAVGGGVTTINGTAPVTVTGTGNTRTVAVADATTVAKGAVQLADAAAITAGTAGRVVDAAQLKANVPVLADATTTVKGVVQLATSAEAAAGTDAAKAVTSKALHDGYLAKNISTLPALP